MSPDSHFTSGGPPVRPTNYRLLDRLGDGGFGEVYRAHDTHTNRLVALKLLWGDSDMVDFAREVESHARLHHSHIAQIYDCGQWPDGRFFIVLQLVEGSNLFAKLGEEGMRDPRAAAQLMAKVARAVHFAHENYVLHCDLKPNNILIDRRGMPFVTDFSIACLLDRERPQLAGATVAYAAPEHCEGAAQDRNKLDRWTDVYALGSILYQLATGETPYPPEQSLEDRLAGFVKGELPRPPSAVAAQNHNVLGRKLDRDFDRICGAALAINPKQRYPSADALADDLDRWVLGLPICGPDRTEPSASEYIPSFIRRNARALSLSVLPLLVLLVASLYATRAAVARIQEGFETANRTNAQLQGQLLAARFETYRQALSELAQDPAVRNVLLGTDGNSAAAEVLSPKMSAISWRGGPDQFYFIDTRGCFTSYWPSSAVPPDVYLHSYSFRNYFTCAQRLAHNHSQGTCFARVFRSEYDSIPNTLRSAIATPVYADDDSWIGVLAASWPIERSLLELALSTPGALRATTSLLVARDRERAQLKAAGVQLPRCGRGRALTPAKPAANPHVGPALRDELLVLPRSAPRDERFLSKAQTARIGAGVAGSAFSDKRFLDPRDGKHYDVAYAALNQRPSGDRAVDHAPLLVVALDRELIRFYTGAIYSLVLVLWLGSALLLWGLLTTLARRDREQLHWLRGSGL